MNVLFFTTFIFGLLLFYIGIRSIRIQKINNRFLNEFKIIKSKTKIKKNFINSNFLRNIYTSSEGFKKSGLIALSITFAIIMTINAFFLNFNSILVAIFAFLIGVLVVNKLHQKAITDDFEKNFPELLVVLNGAISAGANVTQALSDSANSIDGILGREIKLIVKSLSIGDDMQKVFDLSYTRLPFKSYYFFLTALSVSLNSGAKLKEILSRLSSSVTKAKAMEKKKNALTSEARTSSKITAAIPFAFLFLMKFISPENFDFILHDEHGRYILYYFLGSEFIGMIIILFLMRKI